MPVIAGIVAAATVGGGIAGFIFYRRSQQRSTLEHPSKPPDSETPTAESIGTEPQLGSVSDQEKSGSELKCPSCSREVSSDYRICPFCGTNLSIQ